MATIGGSLQWGDIGRHRERWGEAIVRENEEEMSGKDKSA